MPKSRIIFGDWLLKIGHLYEVRGYYGRCYFYVSCETPYNIVKIENGSIIVYLGKVYSSRNSPFCGQYVYEFLFENRKIYLFDTTNLVEFSF